MSRRRWGDPLAKNPGRRQARVNDLLRREVGEILQMKYTDSSLPLITVTEVRVSGDLKNARIFLAILGDDDECDKALHTIQKNRPQIRQLLADRIVLKYVPTLFFLIDDSAKRAARIEELLSHSGSDDQQDQGNDS